MCSPMSWTSLSLSLQHCGDIQDTGEHISARSFPYFSLFDTAGTSRTQASTLVLARFLISLSSTPCGRTGHERAYRACSCLECPSLSYFLWMPRTRVSTNVLAHVLDVSIPVPSTLGGHPGHRRAH